MAYTTPSTYATGTLITSTHWAIHVNDLKFLHGPPTVKVTRSTSQSITPSGSWVAISFNSESWDTNTMWSSTAPTKLIARTAGKFEVKCGTRFAASTGGTYRGIGIRKNSTTSNPTDGSQVLSHDMINVSMSPHFSNLVSLTAGQYVQIVVNQDSGGAINIDDGDGGDTFCSMLWVSS